MINVKKAPLLATIAVIFAPGALLAAHESPHDVVKNTHGHIVTSTNGNCVETKWESATDECKKPAQGILARLGKEQRTVHFDFNKSTLNVKEKAKLDEVSKIIMDSKEVASVDIVGYADRIGASSYNKKLSVKRAKTVKSFLAARGLKTRNIRVEGMGETGSKTRCDDKMGRSELIACLAADRRVEIELNVKQ